MAVALRHAAALKPEIQLAQALSEYEAILTDDQKTKLRTYHGQPPLGVTDVMRLTAEIDRENSHREGRRCVGPRLTNVLQAVQQFSTIVDTIVGSSQSQIAGAIWGVVKMTLQVTSSFSSYFDNLSTLFMNIGRTCPRYQDFGFLFPKSAGLQRALCEYFVVVVRLCKQAVLFIRKPFFSQFSSSVLKPFQSEFGHFEIDLRRLANAIREEASLASKQEQSLETKESSAFRAFAVKFSDKVSQEARQLKSRKAKSQFLDACSTYNHQTAWKQARKAGTTSWIYSNEEYKQWIQEPISSTLWCTGILGSGKTVLSANMVENIILTSPAAIISYFFCRYDEAESLKARTIIGSMARQLFSCVKPEVFDRIDPIHRDFLDTDQILEYLRKLLPSEHQEYFILIDGLDECDENDLKSLIEHLKELLASRHVFHIYYSSRPDAHRWVSAYLPPRWNVSMSQGQSEIAEYIKSALEECLDSGNLCLGDPALILIIQDALVKGSQGMFLWVVFQLKSICSQATDEEIINTLHSLPKDLPETFNRILQKLEQTKVTDPRLCKKIFELIAAAQRSLTLEELREAISVVPGETAWNVQKLVNDMRKTLDCCGSLLMVDEEHSTVHFAHHSVKQHLLSSFTDPNVEQYHLRSLEADSSLGEICVTYLNFDIFNTQLTKTKTVPQSQAVDVPSAILRGTLPRSKIVNKLALRLLKGRGGMEYDIFSQLQEAAGHATELKNRIQQEHSFLAYAQEYWLFHSKSFEPTREISYPLWRHLVTGVVSTVRLPWTPEDWSNLGFELLKWTVENEHGALLYRIFDKFEGRKDAKIDLLWKMLLAKGAGFHVQGKYYGNALRMASASGHEAVVRLLLQKGPDIETDLGDGLGRTPLSCAAQNGHEAVVKLLLEKGAALESKDNNGQTPLSRAAQNGHEAVAKLLLEKGAALESKDHFRQTPLSRAAENGHEAAVKLLLEKGAALESIDKEFDQTPLSRAAGNGHEAAVKLLLEKGAALESRDKYGQTPLSRAAENGHEAVVKLLLEKGAALESREEYGQTPLSRAAEKGHEAVVKLLLEKGATLESREEFGQTPLSRAAGNGHEAVVKLLLEKGATLESREEFDQTPLSRAAENGHEAVVKLLLEKGATLESRDEYGRTPLSWAAGNGHEAVVKLLLEKGATLESKDKFGRTPLSRAAGNGHEAVVKLLLEKGATLESGDKDSDGRRPLSRAAKSS